MTIKVQTPDGGTAHFPDGTSATDIESALNQAFPAGAPAKPAVSMAEDVAKSGGVGVANGLVNFAGTPAALGSWLGDMRDEYITNPIARKFGFDEVPVGKPSIVDYAKPETIKRGVESVTGEFYHPQTRAGRYAETVGEMVPFAMAGPGGLARKVVTQAVMPGVASEAAGEATAGSKWEPFARVGGAIAGGIAGAGVNKAITGAQNFTATRSAADEIGDIIGKGALPAGAVRRVADNVTTDALTPSVVRQKSAELGNEAMLLDMGRQVGGRAEAIASQPGRGQNMVLDAVENRVGQFGDQTAQRIKDTLDRFVGPSPNVVETQKRVDQVVDALATPQYKRVMAQHPEIWDDTLAALADRPVIAQGMRDAVSLARNYGEDVASLGKRAADDKTVTPSLQFWDYVKKSIDHRINSRMERGGLEKLDGKDKADLGGLVDAKNALTNYLDELTGGEYALARKLSATKFEVREAGDFGRKAFQHNLLPEEFAARVADMSLPEQTMAKAMMRREIERVIDTARNDGAAARRFLDTTQNGQKIEAIFGPQALKEIESRLAAETQFQNIKTKVADNSRTAVRRELVKDTEDVSTHGDQAATLVGMARAGVRGGLNYIRNNGMSNTREAIADLLTTRGPQIEEVVKVMNDLSAKRAANNAKGPVRLPLSLVPNSLVTFQNQR